MRSGNVKEYWKDYTLYLTLLGYDFNPDINIVVEGCAYVEAMKAKIASYNTTAYKIGKYFRGVESSLDGRTNGGKAPKALQILFGLNPLYNISEAYAIFSTGKDFSNETVNNRNAMAAFKLLTGIYGFGMGSYPIKKIVAEQVADRAIEYINSK